MRRRRDDDVTPAARSRRPVRVGAVNDAAERRADLVAQRVVAGISTPSLSPAAADGQTRVRRSTQRSGNTSAPIGAGGGELDNETSDRIDAARSGGSPMPAPVRRRFEGAMGSDLGRVRLHTGRESDELNRQLGSTAFTSGSDVFFRGGLPDLGTHGGRHLVAHELAHVAQQGHDVGRVRRAVGFEFEVGKWTVEKIDRSLSWKETGGWDAIPDGDVAPFGGVIANAGPWRFTGDTSNDGSTHLEWVMASPVEETDAGRDELEQRMDALYLYNEQLMAAHPKKAKIRRQSPGLETRRVRGSEVGLPKHVLVQPWATMEAEPQMTAGIALDRVYRIMENLDKKKRATESEKQFQGRQAGAAVLMGKGVAEKPMVASSPQAARTAFATTKHPGDGAPTEPSNKLIGMLSLMRTYLIGAQQKKSYAKGIAPLLLKTDFAKLFSMLPTTERDYYSLNADIWEKVVLATAGLTPLDADQPLFTNSITYVEQRGLMDQLQYLERGTWIRGLALYGVDYCTPDGLKRLGVDEVSEHLFGFGSLGDKTDTVGREDKQTNKSAVIEFRRLSGKLPHTMWKDFALELFDYVRAVNAHKKGSYSGEGYYH